MVIAAVSPAVAVWIAHLLPGDEPAPLSTMLIAAWVIGLVAYWIARSAAEHRFAVTMQRTVLPGEDVFHDLERLDHVHPDEVARSMAHRLEVLSAALPVAAAATIVPATVAYIAMGVHSHGWPSERMYEEWVAGHAGALAWMALVGLVASVAMTRRSARLPIAAPIAAVATLAAAGGAAAWWWLVGPAAIAATVAIVVRRLRIERGRIQAEDPAAGSEVFTLRGVIQQIRASVATTRAFVRAHRRGVVGALAVVIGGWALLSARHAGDRASAARAAMTPVPTVELGKITATPLAGSQSTFRLDPSSCESMTFARGNCVKLEIMFHDHEAMELASVFPGIAAVPAGWHAVLNARFDTAASTGGKLLVTAFHQTNQLDSHNATGAFDAVACDAITPASLRVAPDPKGPSEQHVTLLLYPTLELAAPCVR
jgi:hypothetical protein